MYGNWSAPEAVTAAAIIYCLRCSVDVEFSSQPRLSRLGCYPCSAFVGGNVLTSHRVTDAVLNCLSGLLNGERTVEDLGGVMAMYEIEFSRPVVESILSERRLHAPRGLKRVKDGASGANHQITKDKRRVYLGGKPCRLCPKLHCSEFKRSLL
ncbi:hypothetical protein SADUNF_Sadunf17G0114700 [Salix dunnii]|uniref:Uncharacterized protein n=1 Tax=Salix dunnii TaxID=1413687 RepID=A0A835MFD0_9ROSI|nr:hypothetical protein SADUNF_Sadunf17G0114700 [Salix dunnii]